MAFTSFFRPCCINIIHPYSSVSRSNSDFCICKFKLIAFLGNYSMYCSRPDHLRASKRVCLRETKKYLGYASANTALPDPYPSSRQERQRGYEMSMTALPIQRIPVCVALLKGRLRHGCCTECCTVCWLAVVSAISLTLAPQCQAFH